MYIVLIIAYVLLGDPINQIFFNCLGPTASQTGIKVQIQPCASYDKIIQSVKRDALTTVLNRIQTTFSLV